MNRIGIVALLLILLLPGGVSAVKEKGAPGKLVVGTMDLPPFVMKTADGRWDGLSYDLWLAVSNELGVDYEVREFTGIKAVVNAVETGEVDLLPVAIVSPKYELFLDFTNHYYRSGLAIAVITQQAGPAWLQIVERLIAWQFMMIVGILILLWAIAGTIVWLFESRCNSEMFGDRPLRGIGQGIWWGAVTMTTVGYGDKAPKTIEGRVVAAI